MNNFNYRYPGSSPFEDNDYDRMLFFGRDREKQALFHLVMSERLSVLFAKSGIGKTSLIHAGINQMFRDKGFIPLLIRFHADYADPFEAVYKTIEDIAKRDLHPAHLPARERENVEYISGKQGSLWEYFKTVEFWTSEDVLLSPVVIFDQFEEFFAVYSPEKRKEFIRALADLVRNRIPAELRQPDTPFPYSETPPDVRILIAIREDYLGLLEEMADDIPHIFQNRFRLLALTREQAKEAIIKPAALKDERIQIPNFTYKNDALDAILEFLCKRKERDGIKIVNEIESFQLQLICRHIENGIAEKSDKQHEIIIARQDLSGLSDVLQKFYVEQLNQLEKDDKEKVTRLCEEGLISVTDRRLSLEQEEIERNFNVLKPVLEKLVNSRLLRAESRVGSVYYELSHDTIVSAIKNSNYKAMLLEFRDYCNKALAMHEKIPLAGFKTRLRIPILIEDIYVPLRAMVDLRPMDSACFADSEDAEKHLERCSGGQEISILDAFAEAEKIGRHGIVILGDPGAGKTTHLKRVLLWAIQRGTGELGLPDNMIPVFLPLGELRDLNSGLDAFIQQQLDSPHLETPPGFGKRLLARGNLLFLLDGLDEVADSEQRVSVSRWIEDAMRIHRNCRFVVTCRFAGYTEDARLSEEFIEMHIRPLISEQAETFIRNWYRIVMTDRYGDSDQAKSIASEKSQDLIDLLRLPEFRARKVFAMTRNPLLLTNLCLIHLDRGNLPHSRASLYEECTDVLLERWRSSVGIKTRIGSAKTGRRVLQPAALWLHQKEKRTRAKASELAPVIEPALKAVGWAHGTAEDFLRAVRDDSGILTGWDEQHYGFIHLGFQEYLAAEEILRRAFNDASVLRDLAQKFGDPWWQEVGLLLLAIREAAFEPYMTEVVQQPAFAQHPDLVEMCLDDAAQVSALPFLWLLEQDPTENEELWERQLLSLRIVDRLDKVSLNRLISNLKNHPYEKIRQFVQDRLSPSSETRGCA